MGEIYLGRLFGIPFRLHWSWFLALFLIAWTLASGFFPQSLAEYPVEPPMYWLLGLLAALGLFLSILLHELGHAYVAHKYGIPVRSIRLFVFGGVAELGGEPRKPRQEILIALGGPAVTVILILFFNLCLSLLITGSSIHWDVSTGILKLQEGSLLAAGSAAVLFYLGMINTMVLIFNLIPAFPLDGGRVLRGILWAITGNYVSSTRIAGTVGIAFAWFLFIMGFLSAFQGNLLGGVWLFFLGTFLQNAAQSSIAYAQLRQILPGVRVADMMRHNPVTLDAGLTLREAVDQFFMSYPYKAYPVIQEGRYLGMLTLRGLQSIPREEWDLRRVGESVAQHGEQAVISPHLPVMQALQKLAESGNSRLAVVDRGVLVGLLCSRDVMSLIENRAGLASPDRTSAP
ncbi:MAG TPA: site-2 protease family protein [Gemmatales bacterium]|nr:site-2 protease family protein [Gemmatales bacterium]